MQIGKIVVLIIILLPSYFYGRSIDEEIIVFFQPDVIELPPGQDSALLDEINAPQNVLDCLQAIDVIKIFRALPDFNPVDTLRVTENGWEARLPNYTYLYILQVATNVNRDSAIIELKRLNEIIYAEKNRKGESFYTEPNDEYFNMYQWNLNDETGNIGIDVMRAWDLSRGSNNIKIGIIESGLDTTHIDLKGRGFSGDPPTSYLADHGTHVCGIAAAMTNNNKGIAGVDWYARIDFQNWSPGDILNFYNAVIAAVNSGSRIINCSWGIPGGFSQTLYSVFKYAYQSNVMTGGQ